MKARGWFWAWFWAGFLPCVLGIGSLILMSSASQEWIGPIAIVSLVWLWPMLILFGLFQGLALILMLYHVVYALPG